MSAPRGTGPEPHAEHPEGALQLPAATSRLGVPVPTCARPVLAAPPTSRVVVVSDNSSGHNPTDIEPFLVALRPGLPQSACRAWRCGPRDDGLVHWQHPPAAAACRARRSRPSFAESRQGRRALATQATDYHSAAAMMGAAAPRCPFYFAHVGPAHAHCAACSCRCGRCSMHGAIMEETGGSAVGLPGKAPRPRASRVCERAAR